MVGFCGKLKTAWVVALLACVVVRVEGEAGFMDSWESTEDETDKVGRSIDETQSDHHHDTGMLMASSVNSSVNSSSPAEKQNVGGVLNNDNFSGHGQNCGPNRKSCLPNTNLECSSLDGSGVCACIAGYVYVRSTESCWTVSKSGADPCNHDIQCHYGRWGNHSRCSKHTGRCECYDYSTGGKRNMTRVEGVCYVAKTRGDVCDNHEECDKPIEGEAYCHAGDYDSVGGGNYRGSCQCREGHIWHNPLRKCLPLATEEGDACVVTQQCRESTLGNLSRCDAGLAKCLCAPGSGSENGTEVVYYKALRKCFFKKEYNDTCEENDECRANLGPDVVCGTTPESPEEKVCHCPPGKTCRSSGFSTIFGGNSPFTLGFTCTAAVIGMALSMNVI